MIDGECFTKYYSSYEEWYWNIESLSEIDVVIRSIESKWKQNSCSDCWRCRKCNWSIYRSVTCGTNGLEFERWCICAIPMASLYDAIVLLPWSPASLDVMLSLPVELFNPIGFIWEVWLDCFKQITVREENSCGNASYLVALQLLFWNRNVNIKLVPPPSEVPVLSIDQIGPVSIVHEFLIRCLVVPYQSLHIEIPLILSVACECFVHSWVVRIFEVVVELVVIAIV